jgi:hypothetical protein
MCLTDPASMSLLEESIYRAVTGCSDGDKALGEAMLRRMTPEACSDFADEQRCRLIAKRKLDALDGEYYSSDEDKGNSKGIETDNHDAPHDEAYAEKEREEQEMMALMGFGSFKSSRTRNHHGR